MLTCRQRKNLNKWVNRHAHASIRCARRGPLSGLTSTEIMWVICYSFHSHLIMRWRLYERSWSDMTDSTITKTTNEGKSFGWMVFTLPVEFQKTLRLHVKELWSSKLMVKAVLVLFFCLICRLIRIDMAWCDSLIWENKQAKLQVVEEQ